MIEALLALILVLAVLSARTYAALRAPRIDAQETRRLGRSRGWTTRSMRPGLKRAPALLASIAPARVGLRIAQAADRATAAALRAALAPGGRYGALGAVGMVHRAASAPNMAFAVNPWIDVTHPNYGAVGDGITDDTAAINLALTAQAANGPPVYFPAGNYLVTSGLVLGAARRLIGAGGTSSRIQGSGFDILTLNGSWSSISNLMIEASAEHASTKGIVITGDSHSWTLNNVFVWGTSGSRVGHGIECNVGLTGTLQDVRVQDWDHGLHLENASNAINITGGRYVNNSFGMYAADTNPPHDMFLSGVVIEGNLVGVYSRAIRFSANQCHFENIGNGSGLGTNIDALRVNLTDCVLTGAQFDLIIPATSNAIHSIAACLLDNGIQHNGTGVVHLASNHSAVVLSGTGPVVRHDNGSTIATNLSGQACFDTGYAYRQFQHPIFVDVIGETTPALGVTVDGCLIKDGAAANALLVAGRTPGAASGIATLDAGGVLVEDAATLNGTTAAAIQAAAEATAANASNLSSGTVPVARLPTATTGAVGAVLKAAALTAPAPSALTDNTGATADAIIENIAPTSSPADAAPTGTSAGAGAATLSTNQVATTASVDTALSTLQTRINALATKASVDAALAAAENNVADLTAMVNLLTARVEDLIALQGTAGQQTLGP